MKISTKYFFVLVCLLFIFFNYVSCLLDFVPMQVVEGSSALVSPAHLDINMPGLSGLQYDLTSAPRHGWLDMMARDGGPTRSNVSTFSSAELGQQRLRYTHDGSETTSDTLRFVAVSNREEDFLVIIYKMCIVYSCKTLLPEASVLLC